MSSEAPKLYDKTGREIMVGDTLKVFHFVAAVRRERCYMYKHVMSRETLGEKNPVPAFRLSHLSKDYKSYYWEIIDGRVMDDYEIVQGYDADGDCFKNRPKLQQHPARQHGDARTREK